jgi:sugar/nucleoside kinase (ribokinase family)
MTLRTLALGGIAWNTMVYLDRFPEPHSQTIFARGSHTTVGSSGAGKALNFASLGAHAVLWGLLGDDGPGTQVRQYLDAAGVELVCETDPKGTMRHVNLMDDEGERISIFANPGSTDFTIDLETVRPTARRADVISITIMNYCRQFLPMLQDIGKPIWVDIHDYDGTNPYHGEFIEAADFLFMSSQLHPDWRGFLEQRVGAGTTVAVATHGARGASGITAIDGWIEVDAVPATQIIDTNGAGDGFFAGFAVEWMNRATLRSALEAGAAQASRAVASPDLAPPSAVTSRRIEAFEMLSDDE